MCGAEAFYLLKRLLISQHIVGVIAVHRRSGFGAGGQRCLELPLFIRIELPYLMPASLRRKLNALLLSLLQESLARRLRQLHRQLLSLCVKELGVFLPLAEGIFTLQVKQAILRVGHQIACGLCQLQRCILSHSDISALFSLAEYVKRLASSAQQRIADVWLIEHLKSLSGNAAAFNLTSGDCWYNWHSSLLIDR